MAGLLSVDLLIEALQGPHYHIRGRERIIKAMADAVKTDHLIKIWGNTILYLTSIRISRCMCTHLTLQLDGALAVKEGVWH